MSCAAVCHAVAAMLRDSDEPQLRSVIIKLKYMLQACFTQHCSLPHIKYSCTAAMPPSAPPAHSTRPPPVGSHAVPLHTPGGAPPLPYSAPYTPLVPAVLRLVRRYVSDALDYLRDLHSPAELLPAALAQRDRMMARLLVDALSARARTLAGQEDMLRECMRMAANAWALRCAVDALDDWTIQCARPVVGTVGWAAYGGGGGGGSGIGGSTTSDAPQGGGGDNAAESAAKLARARARKAAVASGALSSSVAAALRALQDASERDAQGIVAVRIEQLLTGPCRGDWVPAEPLPDTQSPWVDALLSFLQV